MCFSQEEFDTMVSQVLMQEPMRYDMLCTITERLLQKRLLAWSREEWADSSAEGSDLLNDIHLKLMQCVITHFFYHPDRQGVPNLSPEEFEDWVYKVAMNYKIDRVRAYKKQKAHTVTAIDVEEISDDLSELEDTMDRRLRLRKAFAVAMDADVAPYKTLTWMAHALFLLRYDGEETETKQLLVERFQNKTLQEMYDMILQTADRLPWLVITNRQHHKIQEALYQPSGKGTRYGETCYKAFFMLQQGQPSGKKSVSDWMNRMNNLIKRKLSDQGAPRKSAVEKAEKSKAKGGDPCSI